MKKIAACILSIFALSTQLTYASEADSRETSETRDLDLNRDEYDLYERRRDDRDFNPYDFPDEHNPPSQYSPFDAEYEEEIMYYPNEDGQENNESPMGY